VKAVNSQHNTGIWDSNITAIASNDNNNCFMISKVVPKI
jgi:hypothetical protein